MSFVTHWALTLLAAWAVPTGPPLDVRVISQQGSLWCWAASTEMVTRYYDNLGLYKHKLYDQCQLASEQYLNNQKSCGCPGCPGDGDLLLDVACKTNGNAPPLIAHGLDCMQLLDRPLTFCELASQFHSANPGWPVLFEWAFSNTASHLMVAIDAYFDNGSQKVLVNDPGQEVCAGRTFAVDYTNYVSSNTTSGVFYGHGTDYHSIWPSEAETGTCPEGPPPTPPCVAGEPKRDFIADVEKTDSVQEAANAFLSELKPEWFPLMGMSIQHNAKAKVGEAIDVYVLKLDLHATTGATFTQLVFPQPPHAESRDYKLAYGESTIVLTTYRTPSGWVAAAVGAGKTTLDALQMRATVAKARDIPPASISLLQVPVFNSLYLYFAQGTGEFLVPLRDHPELGDDCNDGTVGRGKVIAMSCLLPKLIARAHLHNGMPS